MASPARTPGPFTPEGKRKVSQNARKHGYRATVPIVTAAQHSEIAEIVEALTKENPPRDARDQAVLTQMATAFWNLKQFDKLEDLEYVNPDFEQAACRLFTLTRYRAHHERLFHQAVTSLHRTLTRDLHKQTP